MGPPVMFLFPSRPPLAGRLFLVPIIALLKHIPGGRSIALHIVSLWKCTRSVTVFSLAHRALMSWLGIQAVTFIHPVPPVAFPSRKPSLALLTPLPVVTRPVPLHRAVSLLVVHSRIKMRWAEARLEVINRWLTTQALASLKASRLYIFPEPLIARQTPRAVLKSLLASPELL